MRAVNVFLGADMRMGHTGLKAYALKFKIDLENLMSDEAAIFINRKRTMMKSYSWNMVVSFVRSQDINRPIDISVMDYLAQTFNPDGSMDYPEALKLALAAKLKAKKLVTEHLDSKLSKKLLKVK